VRKLIEKELHETGFLVKTEDYINKVGFSERTNAIIEPKLSMQWFVEMKDLAKPALENVMNNNVQFYPEKFKNTYRHWMENVKDWCISRQLWWGHRIPAWYYGEGVNDFVVALTAEKAATLAHEKTGIVYKAESLKQDEDVLDTWFSSWLWPISVFNGLTQPNNPEINYYYPTNDLVTGPDIMFFWVARMVIAGYEYKGDLPFKNVYYTGIVRDKLGRKMSKSLGNSPDPIELIEQYGADGVRVGVLISSPAGNDLPFDTSQCEQGRNFTNKLWNVYRLVSAWEVVDFEQPQSSILAINWFESKLNKTLSEINDAFDKFRISDALMLTYKLIWDDFCSWYLEIIKPGYEQPIDRLSKDLTISYFEKLLILVHPFAPFITEELWHLIGNEKKGNDIIVASWPIAGKVDDALLIHFNQCEEVVSNIRNIRKQQNIANKVKLSLFVKGQGKSQLNFHSVIVKLGNLSTLEYIDESMKGAFSFVLEGKEFFIPFGEDIDTAAEKDKILAELAYIKGFLKSVQGKLSNERFVSSAPSAVVESEKKKEQDALSTIDILTKKIADLG
jgi:valyl-tRNA synthetase